MSELTPFLHFAQALAEEAGRLAATYYRRTQAQRKSDGTLVTEADERANRLIVERIQTAWPSHAILSEEGTTTYDPAAAETWVIDPLDGTTNFARGLPIWGVSIALLRAGLPVVAVMNFPLLHELYWATAGGGAFCNGEALQTDPAAQSDNQQIFTQCTRTRRRMRIQSPLKARMLGSATYHLLAVASGASLAAVEMTPKVWDLAGAVLIAQEAGALVEGLDGSALFPLPPLALDYAAISRPVLAAANRHVLDEFRASISLL
ncbi:MAG: inositol monophosphatase [Chloroflexi bacterium]|nr:MAG: inositol monophosphatase [Chloroflexota bacterium]